MKKSFLGVSIILFLVFTGFFAGNAQNASSRKNILIILTDQQSANAMSYVMGERYLRTPNMDKIASNGVVFTKAYCANPLCTPSRSSMFTGRYPHELGIQDNLNKKLKPGIYPTLGTLFGSQGYETGYLGKWHLPFALSDPSMHGFQWTRNNKVGGSDALLPKSAADFFHNNRMRPFLLVVSFLNPHNICEWARGDELTEGALDELAAETELPPLKTNHLPTRNENDINRDMRIAIHANPQFPVGDFSDFKWRQYRWAYYRMIEKVDVYIGEVLEALKASGNEDNTLIVFMSDHGDMQGAHQWNQKTVFYEESSRVPFILSGPGLTHRESGVLVNTGTDLIPTLSAYAGINNVQHFPGRDVLKVPNSSGFVVVSNRLSVGKNVFPGRAMFKPEGRMVRSQRYKYWIYDTGRQRESLFDLEKDPGEMYDIATDAAYEQVLIQHREYLKSWALRYKDNKAIEMLNYK